MKVVILLLMLSNSLFPLTAIAKDAKEVVRNNLAFCDQFVIHDPDPRVVFSHMRDCCALTEDIRDCWGAIDRR